jgi:predicted transposase/invertase (TIGR01784 family)
MAEHDGGYKLLFSHPRMVEELLRGFIREEWVADLDFATLERIGDSYVGEDLRERRSDMVWRLRWRGRTEDWFYVYLLLEFQSTPDPFMALRLLGYVALLLAGLVRTGVATAAEGLPAVLPLVLYNGKRPWSVPLDLSSLFRSVPAGCERYQPRLSYLLVDESRRLAEALAQPDSRVATLFRLETCAPEELPLLTSQLAMLLPPDQEPELRRAFTIWMSHLVRRYVPGVTIPEVAELEDMTMLEETLAEWFNGAREEGLQVGREEGQLEGVRQVLLRQMERRFGKLPQRTLEQVRSISSLAFLEELTERVLVADSLQAMGLG